jgi:hypothetical protein
MPELDDQVVLVLREHAVPTTRIGGGMGGATIPVTALLQAVRARVGAGLLDSDLDAAVKRLGGQRTNYADTTGYMWKLRRFFGQSSDRPEDVYAFPSTVIPPPYDEPY